MSIVFSTPRTPTVYIQDLPQPQGAAMAIRAPALPTNAVWLNVERPLTTEDLRSRIVLLDFWTFG